MPDKATEAENTNSAMSKAMGNVPPRDESVSSMRFKMGGYLQGGDGHPREEHMSKDATASTVQKTFRSTCGAKNDIEICDFKVVKRERRLLQSPIINHLNVHLNSVYMLNVNLVYVSLTVCIVQIPAV